MRQLTKVAIMFLVGIFPFLSMGQSKGFQFGIEGGLGISSLRYDILFFPSKYLEAGLGGSFGVAIKYNINDGLAIKTNIFYELKGGNNNHELTNSLSYLTLPLVFQVKFGKSRNFFANFGLYGGYLLPSAQNDYYFHNLDFGSVLGFGANVPISNMFSLTLEIRNALGLVNISKDATYLDKHGEPVTEIGDRYNNSTSLQIGFTYNLDKKSN